MSQLVRWCPEAPFVLVGDGGFACARLAWKCFKLNVALFSRLKVNARFYAIPEPSPKDKRGRKRKKGESLISFKEMVQKDDLPWVEVEIVGYDGKNKKVRFLTSTSLWGVDNFEPIVTKWVLVVDPEGDMDPSPLMSTDMTLKANEIIHRKQDEQRRGIYP